MADITINYEGNAIATMSASGTKTLLTGGKYCTDDIEVVYASPGGGGTDNLPAFIMGTLTTYESDAVTVIRQNAIRDASSITSLKFPNCADIKGYGITACSGLTVLAFPSIGAIGLAASAIGNNGNLETLDFGSGGPTNFAGSSLNNNGKLNVLILRKSSIIPLGNVTAFNGTPFRNGGTGGTIYIPKVLYDHLGDNSSSDYKAATNWSIVDGYGTITWAQIEGSIYENYYADGTAITP